LLFGAAVERKKTADLNFGVSAAGASGFAVRSTTAAPAQPSFRAVPGSDEDAPDPEVRRILDEFQRLHDDAGARRAFYDDLRRTVDQVRAGLRDEGFEKPSSSPSTSPAGNSGRPVDPPAPGESDERPPAIVEDPRPSSGGPRGSLDGAAYRRVVRCAKANGTPVALALGVAWMESRLETYPPRGTDGEVGMFQILPARCRIEGWPPSRLKDPEFNAWLGTRLLARYYQEEGSWARAAAKYIAGPGVFDRSYSHDLWAYINWYASSVESYAGYFSRFQS